MDHPIHSQLYKSRVQATHPKGGPLTTDELNLATNYWYSIIQRTHLSDELRILTTKSQKIPTSRKIYSLNPFVDDQGMLRVGGWQQKARFSYNSRHSIILDSRHPLTMQSSDSFWTHPSPWWLIACILLFVPQLSHSWWTQGYSLNSPRLCDLQTRAATTWLNFICHVILCRDMTMSWHEVHFNLSLHGKKLYLIH